MIFSDKQYEPETLHKLWQVEIEILDVINDFCEKNEIKYSIAYGTLLGAVRHKGFIPWDDDVDIMMLREDYNRFKTLWLSDPPKGYVLEDDLLYEEYRENFMKIRKEGTTFIQFDSEMKTKNCPLGIFVDIFALDRVAPEGFARKKQYIYNMINMLFTRNHRSGKAGVFGVGERVLLSFPDAIKKRIKLRKRRHVEKWNNCKENALVNFCTIDDSAFLFPSNILDNIIKLNFEGKEYCAIKEYDKYLQLYFGDYMVIPPAEKRASHYPLVLDFENDWREE